MEKISVAFDGLKFSKGILDYAINVALKSRAMLTGVFLEDFTYHSYKLLDLFEDKEFSNLKWERLKKADEELRLSAAEGFKNACVDNDLKYIIHHDTSVAADELIRETIYSDLLLIGANETFRHNEEAVPSQFIRDLLKNIQCPVLVVPNDYTEVKKVVLLYDGKPSSVLAIKMFNYLLPWMKDVYTEIVSVVDPEVQTDFPENELIKEFINCHYPQAKYILLYGNPEIEICGYLKKLSDDTMAVLGAYQRGSVSMWFKPSLADLLMKTVKFPLFIAHNK